MKEKTGRKRLAAIAGMLLLIIGIVCAVYMQTGNKEKRVEKDLDVASKYLDELEYEQALAVYQGILEIVPDHAGAYLGIVEVYIRQNEFDTALEYAEKGYEITGDVRLKEKADMLRSGNDDDSGELDVASKYLDELEYEQALAVYQGILEIALNHPDAYLGIVEVYIRQGEFDAALEYAEKGYEDTGDGRLKAKADMIRSGNIYDSRGLQVLMSHYENGTLQWWHQYTYNKEGKIASVTHCDADGTVLGSVELKYDQDGNRLVGYGWETETGELSKIEFTYQNGLVTEEAWYTLSGQQEHKSKFEYKDGVLEKEIIIYADGHESYELYEYNAQGQVSRRNSYWIYEGEETLDGYWEYTYDAAGNQMEECEYWYDEETKEFVLEARNVYEYDDDGKEIGAKAYDGSGNLIGEERYE